MTGLAPADEMLVARLSTSQRQANGVPTSDDATRRERAADLVARHLSPWLGEDGLRVSPLGPGWSRDLDAHVVEMPDASALEALGWLPLDQLLTSIGSEGRGRWAITEDGDVLARLDLHLTPRPDPVAQIAERIARRGEVRLREVLELRVLRRDGHVLPRRPVIQLVADAERSLGGTELSDLAGGAEVGDLPASMPEIRSDRPWLGTMRRWASLLLGRRRTVVGISGIDGSGKSTLISVLREDLRRLGIRTDLVWTRPGMRLGWLDRVARIGRQILGQGDTATVLSMDEEDLDDGTVRSRTGVVGWVWSLLVTLAFLWDARRRWLTTRGVVFFDRHVLDALVTLEVVYGRGVDLRLHRTLVRVVLPGATLTLLLDLPPDVAAARKPEDMHGSSRQRQSRWYERLSGTVEGLVRLDATASPSDVVAHAREELTRGI